METGCHTRAHAALSHVSLRPAAPLLQPEAVETLRDLLSVEPEPDALDEHAAALCDVLRCSGKEQTRMVTSAAYWDGWYVWPMIRWAMQHVATGARVQPTVVTPMNSTAMFFAGTDMAVLWVGLFIPGGENKTQTEATKGLHDLITQGIHPQIRGVLISMLRQPKLAKLSVETWLKKILSRKEFGTAYKGLEGRIHDKANIFLAAARQVPSPHTTKTSVLMCCVLSGKQRGQSRFLSCSWKCSKPTQPESSTR